MNECQTCARWEPCFIHWSNTDWLEWRMAIQTLARMAQGPPKLMPLEDRYVQE